MAKRRAWNKGKKRVKVIITCPECNGWGGHDIAQICPVCDDAGEVWGYRWRTIKTKNKKKE